MTPAERRPNAPGVVAQLSKVSTARTLRTAAPTAPVSVAAGAVTACNRPADCGGGDQRRWRVDQFQRAAYGIAKCVVIKLRRAICSPSGSGFAQQSRPATTKYTRLAQIHLRPPAVCAASPRQRARVGPTRRAACPADAPPRRRRRHRRVHHGKAASAACGSARPCVRARCAPGSEL